MKNDKKRGGGREGEMTEEIRKIKQRKGRRIGKGRDKKRISGDEKREEFFFFFFVSGIGKEKNFFSSQEGDRDGGGNIRMRRMKKGKEKRRMK